MLSGVQKSRRSIGVWLLLGGGVAAAVAAVAAPRAAGHALGQAWPAFALVTGLIAIGYVANAEGVFAAIGGHAARMRGGSTLLFVILMLLVCLVTVVLNLDTSVTFLTPVLIAAAQQRDLDERRFLYGCVFMSNAASLLLPGSNLTNLIVLRAEHVTGGQFALRMLPAWVAAVTATGLVTWLAFPSSAGGAGESIPRTSAPIGAGAVGAVAAGALVIATPDPALPVLILGVVVLAIAHLRGTLAPSRVRDAVDLPVLLGLLGLAVGLGALARSWNGPSHLLATASAWQTTIVSTLSSLIFNNLPAAVLLSAHAPIHPGALLVGLNLGPNIAVTGSLSAYLWFKVSTDAGMLPSIKTYTRVGALTAVLGIPLALAALAAFAPGRL
jgi:arsenical pump membrane protein